MKKIIKVMIPLAIVVTVILGVRWFAGTQMWQRTKKNFQSQVSGLDRIIEVYDINGKMIKKIEGKMDIEHKDNSLQWVDVKTNKKGNVYYGDNYTVIVKEK